jgi:hypothetical protein
LVIVSIPKLVCITMLFHKFVEFVIDVIYNSAEKRQGLWRPLLPESDDKWHSKLSLHNYVICNWFIATARSAQKFSRNMCFVPGNSLPVASFYPKRSETQDQISS